MTTIVPLIQSVSPAKRDHSPK